MLRAVGAGFIACAMLCMGVWLSRREKKRAAAVEDALQAVKLIRTAVTLQLLPLQEAIVRSAAQNPLLRRMAEAPQADAELLFRQHGLMEEEIGILMTLMKEIPLAAAGSDEHFASAQERLRIRLSAREKAAEQAAALYPKLGLLGGAAVFLMLL